MCNNPLLASSNVTPQPSPLRLPARVDIDASIGDEARLEAVRASERWRTDSAAAWDTLTNLAVRILDVPASFVSIVMRDHDAYASQCGLPAALGIPPKLSGQTLCHFTLALDEMLVIGDTNINARTREVPTVASMGVRAYVGVPLHVDGEVIGSFCVVDIVPRTWGREELDTIAQLASSAERELTLRKSLAEGEAQAARARHLAQQREAMLATVLHDLRTPLQVVQLTALLMKKQSSAVDQVLVDRLLQAEGSLRHLTNSLAVNGDLGEAHSLRRPVSLRALVDAAVSMMSAMAERDEIKVRAESIDNVRILVDDGEMLRVMANLIGNSLKFSAAGSEIIIRSRYVGQTVSLSVTDSGTGMSESDLAHAFDTGWQGEAGKARGDGLGLGLNIVATLVERQRGRVSIHSALGAGTRVEISLPVIPEPTAVPPEV
ncbi:MAG: GAF domain-containing sensor histidine kinase [Gammaproteobacteria bacterium]